MAAKTNPQHAGAWEDVTEENLEAERVAADWKRTSGTHIPGKGRRRKESVIASLFRRTAA